MLKDNNLLIIKFLAFVYRTRFGDLLTVEINLPGHDERLRFFPAGRKPPLKNGNVKPLFCQTLSRQRRLLGATQLLMAIVVHLGFSVSTY